VDVVDDAALTGEKAEVWLRRPAAAMMRVEVLNFILILVGWLLLSKKVMLYRTYNSAIGRLDFLY